MPRVKLTDRTIQALKPPERGQVDYFDETTSGFGVRLSQGSRKAFFIMYRFEGRLRRHTFGTYPSLSLADARKKAKDALHAVAHGRDPGADKQADRRAETFGELATEYLESHAKPNKRSWKEDERILDHDLLPDWRGRRAKSITRRDVRVVMKRIAEDRGHPIMANRTLALVRRIFNFAIEREIVVANPCHKVPAPGTERERDRVLGHDELRSLWKALPATPVWFQVAFKLYLFTAQRHHEVLGMSRPELDLDASWWTIPASRTKNSLAHRVPLAPTAAELVGDILECAPSSPWVFPSPMREGPIATLQKPVRRLRQLTGIAFRIHDLRRTAASNMTSIGIARPTVARVLNHLERDVTRVYDRYSYDREKRDALERWAIELLAIVEKDAPTEEFKLVPPVESDVDQPQGYLH